MGWARKRLDRRKHKVWTTPEKEKNRRTRRRAVLSKDAAGKARRYGMTTEIVDG